jgi:hypothetical protein
MVVAVPPPVSSKCSCRAMMRKSFYHFPDCCFPARILITRSVSFEVALCRLLPAVWPKANIIGAWGEPQEIETTTRVLAEGHIQRGQARWHEYGLRPKGFVTARIPGAMPQATVNNGLRPNLGREMHNFKERKRGMMPAIRRSCFGLPFACGRRPRRYTTCPAGFMRRWLHRRHQDTWKGPKTKQVI